MSVSEGVRTRETSVRGTESTNTRNESSLARLRQRISGSPLVDGNEDAGLGDPFAEIFARIATTDAPQPVESLSEAAAVHESNVEDSDRVEEEASQDDQSDEAVAVAEFANTQSTGELVESNDSEFEVDAEGSADPALEVNGEPTQEQSSDQSEDETETLQIDTEEFQIDSGAPIVETEVEIDSDAAVVSAEVAVGTSQKEERRKSEADQTIVADNQVAPEDAEDAIKVDQPTRSKSSDDLGDEQQPQHERGQTSGPVEQVQRRRYTSDKETGRQQVDQASASTESNEAASARPDLAKASTAAAASTKPPATNGIDISTMTPLAGTPATIAASAVVAASSSPSLSAAASSGVKSAATASTASVTSNADGAEPSPGLDTTTKANRTDTSQAASANGPGGTDTLSAVQRAKLMQRVSRGFQQLGPNGGQIRMRLAPEALGSVQLQLNLRDGELSGKMVTQTNAASQALREQLPQLRSSLESQGIRLDHIEIQTEATSNAMDADTSGQRFGDASGQSGNQAFGQAQIANQRQRSSWSDVQATEHAESPPAPTTTWSSPTSGVDLQV